MKQFHSLAELAPEEVHDLLALAARLERSPEPRALAGKILALLFFDPSLRTLASMQAAMARLGGSSIVLAMPIKPTAGSRKAAGRHAASVGAWRRSRMATTFSAIQIH